MLRLLKLRTLPLCFIRGTVPPCFTTVELTNSRKTYVAQSYITHLTSNKFSSVATETVQKIKDAVGIYQFEQSSKILEDLGFSKRRSETILTHFPEITKISRMKIEQQFENLKSLGFKLEEIKAIISKEPQIFILDPKTLRKNFSNLLKQLGDQYGRPATINSPGVLLENVEIVNEKINYCIEDMGLPKKIIAKSGILKYDLSFIRIRHSLVYRAGFYKRPEKKKPEMSEQNPSISELFFTSDEDFVKRFKVSMEDLVVFEAMLRNESHDEDFENDQTEERDLLEQNYKK